VARSAAVDRPSVTDNDQYDALVEYYRRRGQVHHYTVTKQSDTPITTKLGS